jgi:multiple antibiotic resistance protein
MRRDQHIIVLILIESGGAAIITFFGISLPVMQVSGGLVLAAMGWRLLSQDQPIPAAETATSPETDLSSLETCRLHGTVWPCCSTRYRVDARNIEEMLTASSIG